MGPFESQSEVWGILVHPFLPGDSLSSTNLLYREDFLRSVRSRLGMISDWVVSGILTAWRCKGWKLSRTYHGEKPPPFSIFTHICCLATLKLTWYFLAMHNILLRIGTLTRVDGPLSPTCPGTMVPSLTQYFLIYFLKISNISVIRRVFFK